MVSFSKKCGFVILLLIVGFSARVWAEEKKFKGKGFESPQQAVEVLIEAVKSNDGKGIIDILGTDSLDLVQSGDPVADRLDREKFVEVFGIHHGVQEEGPERVIIIIGEKEWPFPIPLEKQNDQWFFDVSAGKDELLSRRIGRNEIDVINVLNTYVDAQNDYAKKDLGGDGVHAFASCIRSDQGKRNGLFWPVKEGESMSPLGPLVAEAAAQGYGAKYPKSMPYHGYYFKVLRGQGKHAYGGAFDYQKQGKMVLGHALLAYPAKYGASGIMTFMVNQQGVIYEKDLGPNTPKLAKAITTFDPDQSWHETDLQVLTGVK
ncbi:conserved hypothetical protein [delta proteobacterium NaphS2]|nr:conserved hypothetical protein [delta proteobacterium NaphS2]